MAKPIFNAEDFLKCSAVGKGNDKCFKDFYPDQEAQESNVLSEFRDEYLYDGIGRETTPSKLFFKHSPPTFGYSEQNQFIQDQVYDYGYTVNDGSTGDQKTHRESRYDNVVHGSYSLIQPDGSKRTVVYTADDLHGFNAVVYVDEAHEVDSWNNLNRQKEFFSVPTTDEYTGIPRIAASSTLSNDNDKQNFIPTEYQPPIDDAYGNSLRYERQKLNSHLESTNLSPTAFNLYSSSSVFDKIDNLPEKVESSESFTEANVYTPKELNSKSIANELRDSQKHNTVNPFLSEVESKSIQRPLSVVQTDVNRSSNEKYGDKIRSQIMEATPNPILLRLYSEIVENLNSNSSYSDLNSSRKNQEIAVDTNSIQGLTAYLLATGKSMPQQTVTSYPKEMKIADIQSTILPSIELSTHHTASVVHKSELTSAVVKKPFQSQVIIPDPSTTDVYRKRLDSLIYAEFPLLAHISPTYARRYARYNL